MGGPPAFGGYRVEGGMNPASPSAQRLTRRHFVVTGAGAALGAALYFGNRAAGRWWEKGPQQVFIGRAHDYQVDFSKIIRLGLGELGVRREEIRGRTILLKPNLVEPQEGQEHINTHPMVVRGAIEAFLAEGAGRVIVAEGAGHRRDSWEVIEASGLSRVLREDRIPFYDLNYESCRERPNAGKWTYLKQWALPRLLDGVDWIVSMPKLKTHHWAGVTLSMKNLFGMMPGIYYGWPKNILHQAGIEPSILDLTATIRPHFCILDGVTGMEGDGPIMGTPRHAGLLVMGRNPPAVDATGARLMGIDPHKIPYLQVASGWLGSIGERWVEQRGELLRDCRQEFRLLDSIAAQRGIRWDTSGG
jgi:uncharacterized protein (DUF362 family)